MRLLAVTVATDGDFRHMAEHAARSVERFTGLETVIRHAADRSDAFRAKLLVLSEYVPSRADAILFFDADCLFIGQWPSVEQLVARSNGAFMACPETGTSSHWEVVRKLCKVEGEYFNSGIWIATKAHLPMFAAALEFYDSPAAEGLMWGEQTPLNIGRQQTGTRLELLPPGFNRQLCFDKHQPGDLVLHVNWGPHAGMSKLRWMRRKVFGDRRYG